MLVHVVHADSVPYVRDGLVRVLHAVRGHSISTPESRVSGHLPTVNESSFRPVGL